MSPRINWTPTSAATKFNMTRNNVMLAKPYMLPKTASYSNALAQRVSM